MKILPRKKKPKYYSLDKIMKVGALYNIIYGQRSNGKTYAVVDLFLDHYAKTGVPSAYIRRLDSELVPKELEQLTSPHIPKVEKWTKGKYNTIVYKSRKFYFAWYNDEDGKYILDENPAIYCMSLNTSIKSKGADRGKIAYTLFDEFLTRQFYLANEFVTYCEILSTLMRDRDGTIHFLVGNTVNRYCPYFAEMGLSNITKQQQGTIDVYTYGDKENPNRIAVEYCAQSENTKSIQKYFAFDNPQLNMIFTGDWEIASYPHAPASIRHSDAIYKAFLIFDKETLCLNLINKEGLYLFVTPWTGDIPENTICYVEHFSQTPYQIVFPGRSNIKADKLYCQLINNKKVFFADNSTGEIYNNWIKYLVSKKAYV